MTGIHWRFAAALSALLAVGCTDDATSGPGKGDTVHSDGLGDLGGDGTSTDAETGWDGADEGGPGADVEVTGDVAGDEGGPVEDVEDGGSVEDGEVTGDAGGDEGGPNEEVAEPDGGGEDVEIPDGGGEDVEGPDGGGEDADPVEDVDPVDDVESGDVPGLDVGPLEDAVVEDVAEADVADPDTTASGPDADAVGDPDGSDADGEVTPPEPEPISCVVGAPATTPFACAQGPCATAECVGTGKFLYAGLELGYCVFSATNDGVECVPTDDRCLVGTCVQAECVGIQPTACDGVCHTGACDPATGCVPVEEGTECDDDDLSTFSSACTLEGTCVGENGCDDGNPCTFDIAFNGVCQHNIVVGKACDDDGDPCTKDQCDAAGVCQHTPSEVGAPCQASCGVGSCDEAGACVDVVEACQPADPCGQGVCDGDNGCITVYDDPGCYAAGAQCNAQQGICTGSWCGDGWCGAGETAVWCEDCQVACYGSTDCSKRYNEVVWAGAYKANASIAYGFPTTGAHQTETFTQMLDDGIRWLHLVIDYCIAGADSGEMCLCAGDNDCLSTPYLLSSGLAEIREWMDAHPEAVVTLKLDEYVNNADLFGALVASGLAEDLYQRWSYQGTYETWPMNLANMANKRRRLVVFGGGLLETWQLYVASEFQPANPEPSDSNLGTIFTVDGPETYRCTDVSGQPPAAGQLYVIEDIVSGIAGSTSWSAASCKNIFSSEQRNYCKEAYGLERVNAFMFQFYNSAAEPIDVFTPFTSPYADQCSNGIDTCTSSSDCSSGICSVWGICISCADDADCAESQYCSDAWKSCLSDLLDGSVCSRDSQCVSGNCDFLCYSCSSDADCDADEWCDVFGGCHAKKPIGFGCLSNAECIDGNCHVGYCAECNDQGDCEVGEYCDLNILPGESSCVPTKALGQGCTNPFECSSGACYTATCVECDQHSDCDADEYCTLGLIPPVESTCEAKRPVGGSCASGVECLSGGCFFGICGECSDDGGCAGDEFCAPDLTCQPKVGIGTACAFDSACLSGNCYLLTCVECNEHADCPEDEFCTLDVGAGASKCAPDKDNGAACTSDAECSSGACTVLVCGECASSADCGAGEFCSPLNECLPKVTNGTACGMNDACQSGNCYLGFCVECDEQGDCGAGQYCTLNIAPGASKCASLKSNGSACGSAVECASGACHAAICSECDAHGDCAGNEYCTLSFGSASTCEAKKPNGSGCASAVECSSNACTLFTCGECVTHSDCGSGKWCDAGNTCQAKAANGKACLTDVECASGNCWNLICAECDEHSDCSSSQYCTLNVPDSANSKCASKKSNGSGCGSGVECSSGICSLGTCVACTALPQQGCNFSTQYCLSAQCHNKKANGQSCGANDQCTSGTCAAGTCQTPCNASNDCSSSEWCSLILGACQPKKDNGTGCTDGQQCSSGICNVGTCVGCATHSQCNANQYCDNVIGGSFTCKSDLANGSGCDGNAWCQSNICVGFKCVQCAGNADCSSTQFCLDNQCKAKKADGQDCAFGDQCTSGCCSFFTCGGFGC